VGDEDEAEAAVAPEAVEQVEDLRLDDDVEGRRRLRRTIPRAIMIRCRMPPENSCG
jgi:hypothetical protein